MTKKEKFAIDFVNWINKKTIQLSKTEKGNYFIDIENKNLTEELLQIYKKENEHS
jgi:hypothetical protein